MSFWGWYWVIMGLFAWGVFGMLWFMAVWCKLSDKYSDIHTRVFLAMILLGGPFMWIFMTIAGLVELCRRWKERSRY